MSASEPDGNMDATTRACLLAGLNEAQQTIRAYDTKAQIVGIGFLFSVTMISNLLKNLDVERTYDLGYLLGGFLFLIGPIVLFGAVLYPSRRFSPALSEQVPGTRQCLYFAANGERSPQAFLADVDGADWKAEIIYETVKLSMLRDIKRKRFICAMSAAGVSFAVILIANILKLGQLI